MLIVTTIKFNLNNYKIVIKRKFFDGRFYNEICI